MSIALTLLFGVLVGLALGLTGGGGSVFAIPLLVFGLGMNAHEAVMVSLAAVAAVALVGAIAAMRQQGVEFRASLIFAGAGLVSAPLGVLLADQWNERTLLGGFSLLVIVVASVMWRKAGKSAASARVVRAQVLDTGGEDVDGPLCRFDPGSHRLRLSAPCSLALVLTGLATGVLSGLFGVGGGFIIVPALMLITQLSVHRAVATSLFVIAIIGAAGVVSGLWAGREIPPLLTMLFISGGIGGLILGQQVAKKLAGPVLQRAFAAAMVLLGVITIAMKIQP